MESNIDLSTPSDTLDSQVTDPLQLVLPYAESDFLDMNLESLMNGLPADDDLYKYFMTGANTQILNSPSTVSADSSEFPDLSTLDLSVLSLQSADTEQHTVDPLPTIQVKPEPVDPKKRRPVNPKEAKNNKKLRLNEEIKVEQPRATKKEEKYQKRLLANKRSAQASRERKKALKSELEQKVNSLKAENADFSTTITELETENKVLKNEFLHLQRLISDSAMLSKLMARANASLLPHSEDIFPPEKLGFENMPRNLNSAAMMYLMIVLYSYGQHLTQSGQTVGLQFPQSLTVA